MTSDHRSPESRVPCARTSRIARPQKPPTGRPRTPSRCHPEQGWSLLCNGVLLFDDTGELLPDGRVINPHRPTDVARLTSNAA